MGKVSNWSRQSQSDEDFTRAAWDLARDVEKQVAGRIETVVTVGPRAGVWRVSTQVLGRQPDGILHRLVAYESEYPNSRAASLAAYLFAHMNVVAQMAESAYAEEAARWGPRS